MILLGVVQSRLGVPMTISPAGLRDGVIKELLGPSDAEPAALQRVSGRTAS